MTRATHPGQHTGAEEYRDNRRDHAALVAPQPHQDQATERSHQVSHGMTP